MVGKTISITAMLCLCAELIAQVAAAAPRGLRTDLLEHTDRVFVHGEASQVSIDEMHTLIEPAQVALIESRYPSFSWEMIIR